MKPLGAHTSPVECRCIEIRALTLGRFGRRELRSCHLDCLNLSELAAQRVQ
jgi:hypothetical protein